MSNLLTKSGAQWLSAVACAAFGLIGAPPPGAPEGSDTLTAPASTDEIAMLIKQLGHPSYRKRVHATRRLLAVGTPAREQLCAAAEGTDAEVALRANAVLTVLDGVMFSGVTITLSLSKTRVDWDTPVDLLVKLTNESPYPARVPFQLPTATVPDTPSNARQVATMLDVAEWLRVEDADGREIDLTVDDIAADPHVEAVVEARLDGGPTAQLAPGRSVTIAATAFNRGWARYRLLDEGSYAVQLDYLPQWDDQVLAGQRVGRVESNRVKLTVHRGAPESVSRRGEEASLKLCNEGVSLVAILTNRSDHKVFVNKNFGSGPPFAQARWRYRSDTARGTITAARDASGMRPFNPALLVPLEAGDSLELARTDKDRLIDAVRDQGEPGGADSWDVYFSYTNLLSRRWRTLHSRRARAAPSGAALEPERLPRHILFTSCSSNVIALDRAD